MFKLSRKKKIFRLFLVGVLAIVILPAMLIAIVRKNNNNVNAADETVTIGREDIDGNGDTNIDEGDRIYYGSLPDSGFPDGGWATRKYLVNKDNKVISAYCAQPRGGNPTYPQDNSARVEEYTGPGASEIKLLVYMNQNNIYTAEINNYFNSLGATNADLRYAYTHALIGDLYNDIHDLSGLTTSEIAIIKDMEALLTSYVSNNNPMWIVAKNYTLYVGINITDPANQDVIWLEGDAYRGSIKVSKCDSDTNACNISGVNFAVYNHSGATIYDPNGHTYADGELIASQVTNSNGVATFSNLLVGFEYLVKETTNGTTNTQYVLTASDQTATITTNGGTSTLKFYNRIVRGDVKFVKKDSSHDDAAMGNVIFRISALDSNNQVIESHIVVSDENGVVNTANSAHQHSDHTNGYDELYAAGQVISYSGYGTWFGLDGAGHQVTVDNTIGALPYGNYKIQELECSANRFCYETDTVKTFTINTDNKVVNLGDWDNECADFSIDTSATDNLDGDKFIVASATAAVKDSIHYCAKVGDTFTIKGVLMDKATNKALTIDGKTIEKSISVTPQKACETVEMVFELDAADLSGKQVVVFESLYYGEEKVASHEDINAPAQTVAVIDLYTNAANRATGKKTLPPNEDVEIEDTVTYCLVPGLEYTVKGILMDKKTGKELLINEKAIESEITFTPEEACGETAMYFKLNTTDLGGAELVIFEALYLDDEMILEHKDINNASETVTVDLPVPETGYITADNSKGAEPISYVTIMIATPIIVLGGYIGFRIISRRKFLL